MDAQNKVNGVIYEGTDPFIDGQNLYKNVMMKKLSLTEKADKFGKKVYEHHCDFDEKEKSLKGIF